MRSSVSSTTTRTASRSSIGQPSSGRRALQRASVTGSSHHIGRDRRLAVRAPLGPYSGDMSDRPGRRWRTVLAAWLARVAEIALALIGLAYVFGAEDTTYKIYLLGLFALVALSYLSVGFWVVRHGRDQPRAEERPAPAWRRKLRRKF